MLFWSAVKTPAAPPPGATSYGAGAAQRSASEHRSSFHLGLGMYSPSLSTINDELKRRGLSQMRGGTYFDIGGHVIASDNSRILMAVAYWSGSSSNPNFTRNLSLYMFNISPRWELTALSDMISPAQNFRIGLGFLMRGMIVWLADKNLSTGAYVDAMGMVMDLGPEMGLEFYPVPGSRSFSVSTDIGHILLSWNMFPLDIVDTNITGLKIGEKYKTYTGGNMNVDTNGLLLRLGINFYY